MICIWVFWNLFFIEHAWVLNTTWFKELRTIKIELKIWSTEIFIWSLQWWFAWFPSLLSSTPFLHVNLPSEMFSFGMQDSTTSYLSVTLTSYIFICFVLGKLCFRYHFKNYTCSYQKRIDITNVTEPFFKGGNLWRKKKTLSPFKKNFLLIWWSDWL